MALQPNDRIEFILQNYFKISVGAEYDKDVVRKLRSFEVRNDDIFLIGLPKTGTTWAQEMIWLISNKLDFEGAKTFIDERFPVLELFSFDQGTDNAFECHKNSLEYINKQKSPRFIKTHMRGSYLPEEIQQRLKTPKIIYITRDAKDTCLSTYYYFKDMLKLYTGNFEDFCEVFIAGRIGSGLYWDHVLYFWERRTESNVLFITYEDMKSNLSDVIRKIAIFLDKPLTDGQVMSLTKWLDFDSMKNNSAVNHYNLYKQDGFMRSGKVGEYKTKMAPDMAMKFNIWTQECLKGTDLNIYK